MAEFQKVSKRFIGGIQCRPGDVLDDGKVAFAKNVRAYSTGELRARPGLLAINSISVHSPIHSIKRLNDEVGPALSTPLQAYARFLGAGTRLFSDSSTHDAFNNIDSGYSGNPLSFIAHRPEQSPQPWLYIADSQRLRKAKADGTNYLWGVRSPNDPATAKLSGPVSKAIDDFEVSTFAGWAGGGAAVGALTNPDRIAALGISQILYDEGTTGWAQVSPASLTQDIQEGMFLTTSANIETVIVEKVYKAVTSSTIDSIQYDSGSTGLCTVQLTTPTAELIANAMLRNTTQGENIRVLSVTSGPTGLPSFRCSTVATFAAGDAIQGLGSFRAYFQNNHTTSETLSTKMLQFVVSGSGVTYLTRTVALDLSTISGRPVRGEDVIYISINVDNLASLTEGRIMFEVDSATPDFTHNYYYKDFRANDLTPAVSQTQSSLATRQQVLQRVQLENEPVRPPNRSGPEFAPYENVGGEVVDPANNQTVTGDSQWTVLKVKVSDLIRVGSDSSRGLKDVGKIRISVNAAAALTLKVDAWWLGGTFGADSTQAAPYFWVYRYRSGETGAKSNPSPPQRAGMDVTRGRVILTPACSSDAQVTKIDWYRFGGTLNNFYYIGTQENSDTFSDDFSDDVIAGNPILDEDNYLPFPVIDRPRSGYCNVSGTTLTWRSGDKFNTNAIRGTEIIIDGVLCSAYARPADDSTWQLNENLGTKRGVTFLIPDAVVEGQALPAVFGSGNVIFGVKGGTLYWTRGNDPDSASRSGYYEVTSGSETLMHGGYYDGRPYVFSTEKMYEVLSDNQGGYYTQEVANSKGLASRWGAAFGEHIWFIGKDGVYESDGGQPTRISDDLGALLPHDGQAGVSVNGITPPDFNETQQLAYYDGMLYWDFLDTSGDAGTLVFDVHLRSWFYDSYAKNISVHYGEEGVHSLLLADDNGTLYQSSGTIDDDTAISCQVRTGSIGDLRSKSKFGDVAIDTDSDGVELSVAPLVDFYNTSLSASTITTTDRSVTSVDFNSGEGEIAQNLALDIMWSSDSQSPKLYGWECSFLLQPDDTTLRATDWTDCGYLGAKYMQGVRVECDTESKPRTVEVHYYSEDGVEQVGATLTVQHNGQSMQDYSFDVPFYANEVRLVPTGSDSWRFFRDKWDYQPAPERGTTWWIPPTTFGMKGYFHISEIWIAYISDAPIIFTFYYDGVGTEYEIPSSNGVYTKYRFNLQPSKGKSVYWKAVSTQKARIFQQDIEVLCKSWGDSGGYQSLKPFGGPNYTTGAEI